MVTERPHFRKKAAPSVNHMISLYDFYLLSQLFFFMSVSRTNVWF